MLTRRMSNPRVLDLQRAYKALVYLMHTALSGVTFSGNDEVEIFGWADSAFNSGEGERKNCYSYCFQLGRTSGMFINVCKSLNLFLSPTRSIFNAFYQKITWNMMTTDADKSEYLGYNITRNRSTRILRTKIDWQITTFLQQLLATTKVYNMSISTKHKITLVRKRVYMISSVWMKGNLKLYRAGSGRRRWVLVCLNMLQKRNESLYNLYS